MLHEVRVDDGLGEVEALIAPGLEFAIGEVRRVNGVVLGEVGNLGGVPVPVLVAQGSVRVAGVGVDDGVPDGVEVLDAVDAWVDPLGVATAVALGVLVGDARDSVEGLVNIANVVNDEAESEGNLVFLVIEALLDLVDVGVAGHVLALEEVSEGLKGVKHVSLAHLEVGVVLDGATVSDGRLVDEVPVALPGVALALDVVTEGGALGEGVLAILLDEAGVRLLQVVEVIESGRERIRGLLSEDGLGSSRDEEVTSAPEGASSASDGAQGKDSGEVGEHGKGLG
mmetsp:Transcript_14374/g.17151  ORF Transcript_14374/g.17151 Transcript_14374/m.17151 type:complete len:283 (+) Transcript_14374:303-1151(+)